jgi:hypothetical protein
MPDTTIRLTGDPSLPFKAVDLGDSSYALDVTAITPGTGASVVVRLTGDPPLPFRAVSNDDGTYSLSVAAQ